MAEPKRPILPQYSAYHKHSYVIPKCCLTLKLVYDTQTVLDLKNRIVSLKCLNTRLLLKDTADQKMPTTTKM